MTQAREQLDLEVAYILNRSHRNYSTDWTAAMYAVETMLRNAWAIRIEQVAADWWCDVLGRGEAYRVKADTGPLAICLAIVATKGIR